MPADRSTDRRLLLACLGEAGLVVVAVVLAWLFEVPLAKLVNPEGRQLQAILLGVVATLPMVAFLAWMLRSRWRPVVAFRNRVERLVGGLLDGASPSLILLVAILAGVGEELLFRGALQPILGNGLRLFLGDLGPWGGVVAASILFGLAHPMSRAYVLIAGIGGLYLGALAHLSGEILSAVVAHALYDVVALGCLRRTRPPSGDGG